MTLTLDPETARAVEEAGRRLARDAGDDRPQIERLIDALAQLNDEAEAAVSAIERRIAELHAMEAAHV